MNVPGARVHAGDILGGLIPILSDDDSHGSFDGFSVRDEEDEETTKSYVSSDGFHRILQNNEFLDPPVKHQEAAASKEKKDHHLAIKLSQQQYGRITAEIFRRMNRTNNLSVMERMADEAWALGQKAWEEANKYNEKEIDMTTILEGKPESCPSWVSVSGEELAKRDFMMFLPCGLAAGSSITVIGTPRYAHQEYVPQLAKVRAEDALVLVSQFMVELQGLKVVNGGSTKDFTFESSITRRLEPSAEYCFSYERIWQYLDVMMVT
ncbi:Hydroxyproline O-galactosyltransferase GALT2 [Sesamum angolense]|uniref:Hydroxyproline O-galactosyltransferase GALT2 n=1 Tax=Sesamum angolense TaxID=2727404 RepID=A0AAE1WTZ5_9LAMI|nr:Hydroxyproline O-galactosyltransferase GALT2 [Sesamum angolense]